MGGEDSRRSSLLPITNPLIEVTDTSLTTSTNPPQHERTPSPVEDLLVWKSLQKDRQRRRIPSDTQYADTEVEELLAMLRETESLEEQGDILQYLVHFQSFIEFKNF